MKRCIWVVMICLAMCCCGFKCQSLQVKEGDNGQQSIIAAALEALRETTESFGEGIDKLDKVTTEAEKETAPVVSNDDAIQAALRRGAAAAQPFVPAPFNYLVTLIPVAVGWFRSNNKRKKREKEEELLISGLQLLKKHNAPAFEFWLKCRDAAVNGKLKASELEELLQGIAEVKTRIPSVNLAAMDEVLKAAA